MYLWLALDKYILKIHLKYSATFLASVYRNFIIRELHSQTETFQDFLQLLSNAP